MRKIIFFISSLIIYGFFYFGPQTISVYACNANATGEQGNCQAGFTCTGTAQAFTGNIVGGKCVANKPKPAQPNTCTANADYTKGSCQNGFVCTGTAENLTGNIVGGTCIKASTLCTSNEDYEKGTCPNNYVCTGTPQNLTGNIVDGKCILKSNLCTANADGEQGSCNKGFVCTGTPLPLTQNIINGACIKPTIVGTGHSCGPGVNCIKGDNCTDIGIQDEECEPPAASGVTPSPTGIPPISPPCVNFDTATGTCTDFSTAVGNIQTSVPAFITAVFGILVAISGGVALLTIIYAGYRFMTSQGKPEALQQAREQLIAAIVGLLFIIFSLVILQAIGVDILNIPGLKAG